MSDGNVRMYNRLEDNFHLSNKKALFRNIVQYYKSLRMDPFEVAIPLTFHMRQANQSDNDYKAFLNAFQEEASIEGS